MAKKYDLDDPIQRLKAVLKLSLRNGDSKTAFEATKKLNEFQTEPAVDADTEAAVFETVRRAGNVNEIMDALDEHLGFLTDSYVDIDYLELIKLAGAELRKLQAPADVEQ